MPMPDAFRRRVFWQWFFVMMVIAGMIFAWELDAFKGLLPSPSRPDPTRGEILYAAAIIVLMSFTSGLMGYRMKNGTCPIGARNASAIAGGLSLVTLLCPVCLLLPFSLFGIGLSIAFLAPYLPLLRMIVVLILAVCIWVLWPRE